MILGKTVVPPLARVLVGLVTVLLCGAAAAEVVHPCLLVDAGELKAIRSNIKKYDWAKDAWLRVKGYADRGVEDWRQVSPKEIGLAYAITGDEIYKPSIRAWLLNNSKRRPEQFSWQWGPRPVDAIVLYDLAYDLFSKEEHETLQRFSRAQAHVEITARKDKSPTPNMSDHAHMSVGLIGFCLGDQELIDWALDHNPPGPEFGGPGGPRRGGFKQMIEHHLVDGLFFNEATWNYANSSLSSLMLLAEAALHNGIDLYNWKSPNGNTLKGVLDGYLLTAFPLEPTGVNAGSLRGVIMGDGGGNGPLGSGHIANNPWDYVPPSLTSRRFPTMAGLMEVAYKRYRDPQYAWVISLNPKRDDYWYPFGFPTLTHGEPLPRKIKAPTAPSGVYKGICLAMLRDDESRGYWHSRRPVAALKLPRFNVHGHTDHYQVIFNAFGRVLYPDRWSGMYETKEQEFTKLACGHSTVCIDGKGISPIGNGVPMQVRNAFSDTVKFVAVYGTPYKTRKITVSRALFLTTEYLGDFFGLTSSRDEPSLYDWFLHGYGQLEVTSAKSSTESKDLAVYRLHTEEQKLANEGLITARWIQHNMTGKTKGLRVSADWFKQRVGVQMTMLAVAGTSVYRAQGPFAKPGGAAPFLVVRRRAKHTVFAAVHEPFMLAPEQRPATIAGVTRLLPAAVDDSRPEQVTGMVVTSPSFTDYLMVDLANSGSTFVMGSDVDQNIGFQFKNYAYVRVANNTVAARGELEAFTIGMPDGARPKNVTLNGKRAKFETADGRVQVRVPR